jgi:hypothetical protein
MPLLLALRKDGNAYLLNRANLGGIATAIAVRRAARGAIITAPVAYPVRDAMVVAYQARGAACSGDSYVSGIGALAITADPGHRLYTVWCGWAGRSGRPDRHHDRWQIRTDCLGSRRGRR